MKNLFKYEINESIAAKAAMNCVHKRLFKELYAFGSPTPQEEVTRGEYDPYEWEYDDYGNEGKRKLIQQALVQAKLVQSEKEAWQFNNKIQQLLDKTNFPVSDAKSAAEFVKAYGQQIVGGTQEQEETANEKLAIAKQVMANYNPETDEYEDPEVWLRYAIQEHIGKQFLYLPKKEVKAWQRAIEATVDEYEFEKQHPAHYEDEDNLQTQLANAWDEGMEDDDDYVPYENKFDETHRDIVDNLISAVDYYFEGDDDVSGFNHHAYTEDQLGKAVEKVLDKYGDFPSSNNFDKCYAWTKKHAEELMKILETGSLDNSYEGHPEFDF
jgi:hypothetical protein